MRGEYEFNKEKASQDLHVQRSGRYRKDFRVAGAEKGMGRAKTGRDQVIWATRVKVLGI